MAQSTDRGMPAALDAERSCLGAILLDNEIYWRTERLAVTDFSLSSHQVIYSAIIEMAEQGTPIDMVTLSTYLGDHKKLEGIGGVAYLSELTEGLPRRDNIDHYVRIVRAKKRLRSLIFACQGIIDGAYGNEDLGELLQKGQTRFLEMAAEGVAASRGRHVAELLPEVYDRIEQQRKVDETRVAVGLKTGIHDLDIITTGFHPGEVTVVGGYTGEGKTSYLLQAILTNLRDGVPVGFFSLEMKNHDIICRLIAAMTKIMPLHLRDPRLMGLMDEGELKGVRDVIAKLPLYLDDTAGLTIDEVVNRTRLHVRKDGCKLIVVDYLKLVNVPKASGNTERLSTVSGALMNLAKDEKCHIIAASQLSVPEGKKKRQPNMFDLKESGDIANDAHNILLFYRPITDTGAYTGFDELIVEKQRAGGRGKIKVIYSKETLMWEGRKEQEHRDE